MWFFMLSFLFNRKLLSNYNYVECHEWVYSAMSYVDEKVYERTVLMYLNKTIDVSQVFLLNFLNDHEQFS